MRTNPRPSPSGISAYYPDEYGPYLSTAVRSKAGVSALRDRLRHAVDRLIPLNTKIVPRIPPGRLLEVGCASGDFLNHMSERGWQVEGIEFSSKAARAAMQHGFRVHAGPLETAPEPAERYDLIAGWMVLEHLHDPIGALRRLAGWLTPGGWLAISVPNAGALEFRVFEDRWYALHLPNHLYHFTPETLKQVLETGGWTLERIFHQRVLSNLIASAGYALQDNGNLSWGNKLAEFPRRGGRWNYSLFPLAWVLSLLGQTGRMTAWARLRR